MGQSTDAILFYGFTFYDPETSEAEAPAFISDDGETDWEDVVAKAAGIERPTEEYSDATKAKFIAYWNAKSKAVEKEKCEVATHCSCDYPMYYVAIRKSLTRASRGEPEKIKNTDVDAAWDAELKAFCEKLGIPWQEPRWWLASDWC